VVAAALEAWGLAWTPGAVYAAVQAGHVELGEWLEAWPERAPARGTQGGAG
jgi:hypothetical protein